MKFNSEEFYPTPQDLCLEMLSGIDWNYVHTVLEPSAGKGNLVESVMAACKRSYYNHDIDIDCIELDRDLRNSLKGHEFKVVHDDFLTFNTFKKYDLIVMNPPFSNGATHLLKAIDMQRDGGSIVCLLNAETLLNPYSNERIILLQKLQELDAKIKYINNAFISAERPTGVTVALIKVYIPEKKLESSIFESLRKKNYGEGSFHGDNLTDLAPNDFIEAIVTKYNLEVESGVKLIQEYRAMCPHIMNDFKDSAYNKPILELKVNGKDLSTNYFVKQVREKYWNALFRNKKFTGEMTSNLARQFSDRVHELKNYDFSTYNIKCLQLEMSQHLIKGIEDCIIELFDKLSYQHSYYDELCNNIHYFNGWKTNKAWYINKKVIIPYMNAFSSYSGKFDPDYRIKQQLMDIEKALNYLDGGLTECKDMEMLLRHAAETGQTKKIRLKYFTVTFYKKGTCHLEFDNEELLKKLNIFGSQQKGWLPPGYGKKQYSHMTDKEKQVIDDFEGKETYDKILSNTSYYIYEPASSLPALEIIDNIA